MNFVPEPAAFSPKTIKLVSTSWGGSASGLMHFS